MTGLIIDNFAGGGGASLGIEMAMGRPVDVAINHDPVAIAMHKVNHPGTLHLNEDVWKVNPVEVCAGRPVGLAWFSPDCTHFSKAKGGKPVKKKIRGLAWVVLRWAKTVKPHVIMLENVEEFTTWGPLIEQDGKHYPCTRRKGQTFKAFVAALKRQGYDVEHRILRACDYGAPTIRKRLFLIARCDGQPIVWPKPTHGAPDTLAVKAGELKPWRTAAECIDWSITCPSIFERKKPLAEATLRRIAKGIMKYVINAREPFIVPLTHQGKERVEGIYEPFKTITGANRGEKAVVVPHLMVNNTHHTGSGAQEPVSTLVGGNHEYLVSPTLVQTGYGEREGQAPRAPGVEKPLGTVVAGGGKHALVSALLAKHYTGAVGQGAQDPLGTITAIDHHGVVAASITKFRSNSVGSDMADPMHTVTAGGKPERPGTGNIHGIVTANLVRNMGTSVGYGADEPARTVTLKDKDALVTSHVVKLKGSNLGQDDREPLQTVTAGGLHFGEVRAFLMKYYGNEKDGADLKDPMHTVTSKDRLGLVTVHGEEYQIADIGMRMLTPRELFRAQGFPDTYIIDRDAEGNTITKTNQVAKCGNSVCPDVAAALVRANVAVNIQGKAQAQ